MSSIEFEDITLELGRYTRAYFDTGNIPKTNWDAVFNQYRNDKPFPVFTEFIFKRDIPSIKFPIELFNYKNRAGIYKGNNNDFHKPGRIIILRRKLPRQDTTNYFFVWVSQSLWDKKSTKSDGDFEVNMHVNFHPVGEIFKPGFYPPYYPGTQDNNVLKINDPQDPFYLRSRKTPDDPNDHGWYDKNYFELGVRYLFKDKQTVLQHRCAILQSDKDPNNLLRSDKDTIPIIVVIPVSSASPYFSDLSRPPDFKEITQAISNKCFDLAQNITNSFPKKYPPISRVACSFYSRSGEVAEEILSNSPNFINEFYLYDVVFRSPQRTNKDGFDKIWSLLKKWKADKTDYKIRIYSSEADAVQLIAANLREKPHEEYPAKFIDFNGKSDRANNPDKVNKKGFYSGLLNGYEIYSAERSISLVLVPQTNFFRYMNNKFNAGGFYVDDNYAVGDQGHSWFVSRLQTHSIFHSGFKR